ncbi:MAG: DUF4855 domain-containing protein [Planctomycetes bacterium]|nr:DUF4855 domain-containing protein [Planctomycetota bacterium]
MTRPLRRTQGDDSPTTTSLCNVNRSASRGWPMLDRLPVLILLCLPMASALAKESATSSPLWCKHIILIYAQPAAVEFWTKDKFRWLVAYQDEQGKPKDLLFDGFLILGFAAKGGRHLLPVTDKPAIKSDWEDALDRYLGAAQTLSEACEDAARELDKPDTKAKVILTVPYPDSRQKSFGAVGGRDLDFSKEADRLEGVKWHVDEALRKWNGRAEQGRLKAATLVGFYWGHEGIRDRDTEVVKGASAYVHSKGCLMHWIPCLGGARRDWRDLGLDCVTQQINYQNPQKPGRPLTIFDDNSRIVESFGLHGVEMTPMARETQMNPRVWSWHQVHLANLEAALRFRWDKYDAITYFHGNDIPAIAVEPKTRIFYDQLYRWLKGKLTWDDLQQLSVVTLDEQKARGFITDATHAKIASAKTVLEKLQLMEGPKLERLQKEQAEKLAPYTKSSGNLLANGSFEQDTEGWTPLRDATRTQEQAYHGQWSLRLSLESAGTDMVRAYAKSANIPVQPGQLIRLTAWVNVPKPLQGTNRGAMMGLSRFSKGKSITTWSECEVGQTQATNGWKSLTTHILVDDKPCDEVQALVGLCGQGVAYVDAVELVALSKP